MGALARVLTTVLFTSVTVITGTVVTDAPAAADTGWNGT